jgi:hypothetical protein
MREAFTNRLRFNEILRGKVIRCQRIVVVVVRSIFDHLLDLSKGCVTPYRVNHDLLLQREAMSLNKVCAFLTDIQDLPSDRGLSGNIGEYRHQSTPPALCVVTLFFFGLFGLRYFRNAEYV